MVVQTQAGFSVNPCGTKWSNLPHASLAGCVYRMWRTCICPHPKIVTLSYPYTNDMWHQQNEYLHLPFHEGQLWRCFDSSKIFFSIQVDALWSYIACNYEEAKITDPLEVQMPRGVYTASALTCTGHALWLTTEQTYRTFS